jgi:DNA adenine methylase
VGPQPPPWSTEEVFVAVESLDVPGQQPRPFLKWAGGKRQLLPQLRRFYPDDFRRYHEPFLGSGAVFFDLWNLGALRARAAILSDDNADLVGCYLAVRDATNAVIETLERLAEGHAQHGKVWYYRVRDEEFNPGRRAWRRGGAHAAAYPADLAAMLIYLNRTGYNGLFRVNAAGDFNVPMGRYDRPRILDAAGLRAVAAVLAAPGIEIAEARFEQIGARAARGDFVYFDPPYAPLSRTAQFRSYTARGFADDDQERLRDLVVKLARRRVHVLLSNSTAPVITTLYEHDPRAGAVGLQAHRVSARRAINSRAQRRGAVEEMLVTNLPSP